MLMPGIAYSDYYIPSHTLSVPGFLAQVSDAAIPAVFAARSEYADFIASVLGLESIRVEPELDEKAMLSRLLAGMFDRQAVRPGEVDLILVLQETRSDPRENVGQFLQHKFSMANAMVVNLSGNHCANLDVAIKLATALCGQTAHNIVILSATRARDTDSRVVGTYGILGDAAGVVLVQQQAGEVVLHDCQVISKGMLHQADMAKDNTLIHAKYIRKGIADVLKRNQLTPDRIDRVLIQNANPMLLIHVLTEAGFDPATILTANVGRYGHLDTVDLLVNLRSLREQPAGAGPRLILALGMGWAGTYVTSLLTLPTPNLQ